MVSNVGFNPPDYSLDISSITLSNSGEYREDIIQYAKRLKASNPDANYNDYFYIKQAIIHYQHDIEKTNANNIQRKIGQLSIPNSKWAQFSYDEIISMSENGVKIPEEVIIWAYSQKENDLTDYIIMDENIDTEDIKVQNDFNSAGGRKEILEKNIKQQTFQAEKTNSLLEDKFSDFQIISNRAKDIQKEKENSYRKELEEINSYIQEWKQLEEKKKNSNLTETENDRYKELSLTLSQNSNRINEFKNDSNTLQNFISYYNNLNNDIKNSMNISKEINDNITQLEYLNRAILDDKRTFDIKSSYTSNKINSLSIVDLAFDAGTNLENTASEISNILNSEDLIEIINFANMYNSVVDENIGDYTGNFEIESTEEFQEPESTTDENNLKDNDNKDNIQITESAQQNDEIFIKNNEIETNEKIDTIANEEENKKAPVLNVSQKSDDIENNQQTIENSDIQPKIDIKTIKKETEINEITRNLYSQTQNAQLQLRNFIDQIENSTETLIDTENELVISPIETQEIKDKNSNEILEFENNQQKENVENTQYTNNIETRENENLITRANLSIHQLETQQIEQQTELDKQNDKIIEKQQEESQIEEENNEITIENKQNITESEIETNEEDFENVDITYENINNEISTPEEDQTLKAGSASTNVNINNRISTSDKEDRRLTRFNNDSIIESRRKKKKVTAISETRGGTV